MRKHVITDGTSPAKVGSYFLQTSSFDLSNELDSVMPSGWSEDVRIIWWSLVLKSDEQSEMTWHRYDLTETVLVRYSLCPYQYCQLRLSGSFGSATMVN